MRKCLYCSRGVTAQDLILCWIIWQYQVGARPEICSSWHCNVKTTLYGDGLHILEKGKLSPLASLQSGAELQ